MIDQANKILNDLEGYLEKKKQELELDSISNLKTARRYAWSIVIATWVISLISLIALVLKSVENKKNQLKLAASKLQVENDLKLKTNIIRLISHEIRMPLGIFSLFSERIRRSIEDPEIKNVFKNLVFTASSADLMLNQLLEYLRDEGAEAPVRLSSLDIKKEISQLVESQSILCMHKNNRITFKNEMMDGIIVISGRSEIHQLLYNLIGNANKYTEDGIIDISAYSELVGKKLHLKITILNKNNDMSVEEDQIENIKDANDDNDIIQSNSFISHGIGLKICNDIIQRLGGKMSVKFDQIQGSLVQISLQLKIYSQDEKKDIDS